MHPDTRLVAEHMKQFGMAILGRAIFDATFNEMMKPFAHALAVVHAAHGAEVLMKARIAQEHPLLIFDALPRASTVQGELSVAELLTIGRTLRYEDIPEKLWAATGFRLPNVKEFLEFGRLRNQIMHFAVPDRELSDHVLRFAFRVIEPVVREFWATSLVAYAEQWDDVIHADGYLAERLERLGISL